MDFETKKLFSELSGLKPHVRMIDIGANPIDGRPIYAGMMEDGNTSLVGFEPNPSALEKLNSLKGPHQTFLPHAIGDGERHKFHMCVGSGVSSLLPPNMDILNLFHYLPRWAEVTSVIEIDTVRLDDISETMGADFIELDIQGAELLALRNGENRLADALVIHTEVEFLELYEGQPLFSDIEIFLRKHGFMLSHFHNFQSRIVSPMSFGNNWRKNLYGSINQIMWADAIFMRNLTQLNRLSDSQLLKMARILHDCYKSVDVCFRLLREYDRRTGQQLSTKYFSNLAGSVAA